MTDHPNLFSSPDFATRMRREMRIHGITIRTFAKFAGVPMKRVREVRNTGIAKSQHEWLLTLRDCIRAHTP